MKESDTDGLQTSVTTAEEGEKNKQGNGGMARRQFLGAAAVAVGVTGSVGDAEAVEPETVEEELKGTVEWKAAGVWEDHLIPARTALTKADAVDITEAKTELREALQKLEAIEVDDE
ncbi:hypothetical protein [Halorubrum sp. Atlit-28R]|uniref:hypothetical protein n=1 Tax=Halorubrum sp. Atlit-28R TaxID=2282129 RepID=UPI000F2CC620|nr:hypothetical protein [Halorubrum sp. Atlit-28R]RLM49323.1 hypothetical protein DVK06_15240 [Halorubrum sp. Atlit-28R]